MVKLGNLWGDANFASLSPIPKLLYCYLISQPSITTLGILILDLKRINLDLRGAGFGTLEVALKNLKDKEYVDFFYCEETVVTILVIDHFKSLSKSKTNIRKGIDEGKESKGSIREMLLDYFTTEDFKDTTSFKPPTPSEVAEYALSLGYLVNGKKVVEYYSDNDWYNKNNKKVRNWKSTVKRVWCREDNKLESAVGAPKGFEYFFVEIEEGHRIYPQSWVNGVPSHNNHLYAQYLIDKFNERDS